MYWDRKLVKILYGWASRHLWAQKAMGVANRCIVVLTAGYYVLQGGYFLVTQDARLLRFLAVPAGMFFSISLLRKWIPRKRPFETLDFVPILFHEKGNSFPSRHIACAAVIGMAACYAGPGGGVGSVLAAMTPAIALGIVRVAAGVHYPTDVLFGLIWGMGLGYAGFFFE